MAVYRQVTELPELAARHPEGHKGTYGNVLIVAGSRGMAGAAALAGMAALRSGAGLVTVACPDAIADLVSSFEPCYLTLPLACDQDGKLLASAVDQILSRSFDVMALGPGLGQSVELSQLVEKLVSRVTVPLIIDADGLNLLASQIEILQSRPASTILTPHPGEFARLLGERRSTWPTDRAGAAARFAAEQSVVLILKGHGTVISDGERVAINSTGNPGMATGGTGDVLTGMVAALRGQGLTDFNASYLAVYLHGLAGDMTSAQKGEISFIARDLLEALPKAFLQYRSDRA